MLMEVHIIFRYNVVESFEGLFDFNQLKDLQVVLGNFTGECIRANVDDVNIGVFETEHPSDLRILSLLVLIQAEALTFRHRVTVDVDFDSALRLDLRPALLKFRLHLPPHLQGLLA